MSGEMPYVDADDLTFLFNYKNKRSLYEAIRRGTFPIPTYKMTGRIVADREAVRKFFRDKRTEAMDQLASR